MRAPMIVVLAVVAFSAAAAVAAERTTDPDAALLRVARQRVDDLARLRAADIPVVRETLAALFVEGPLALSSRLAAEGYDVKVLDLNAASADYWQIGLRPDSDVDLLQRAGIVLWEEENWILLRVPRGLGAVPLLGARAFLSPLPHEPVDGPRATGEILLERADGTTDPRIEMMIAAASPAVIDRYWNDLVANPPTGTRHSASQGGRDAVAYVKNELEAAGVPAQFHHFDARYAPNVVGELRGAVTPERIYIVVGHLDSIPERGPAPGANDNASGSVNVLTAAAAMSCWPFRNTIRFIASMGEEQGIFGSSAYADEASERGDDIRGVLNFDMIGWGGDGSPLPENLDVNYNAVSEDLGRLFAQCATDYATGIAVDAFLCPSFNKSDHAPFWERGYKAIFGLTDNENFCDHPGHYSHYHETTDTIANCGDPAFFYGAVRTSIATLATLAEPFKVTFVNPAESCDVAPRVVLGDRDLNTDPGVVERVTVEVWSGRETGPEAIVLTEEGPDSMLFSGQVGTTVEPPVAGDGVVSIADQDTLWVRYVDALDCDGAAAVPYTESLPVAVKDPGQNTCRAGSVKLSPPAVACSDTLAVRLTDADLNRSSSMVETVTVTVSSTTEPNPEPLVLTETSPYSALFEGQIPVATGAASADGVLQVAPGDLVTATYHDADDGTGAAAVASDTGTADCAGPGIPSIVIRDLTERSAVVEWTTSETAAARIDWGLTADLGTAQAGGALGTTHTFTLSPLPECGRVYFKLTATDPNGNVTVDDLGGRLHQFNVWTMPGTVFRDGFEDSGNWTLEGEWQIGRPEGKGSPLTDPLAAYEGQQVLGHDLTGLGIYPGDYELYRTERATSRVIDASTLRNGELRFHRSLNADHRAPARIEVFHNGTWNVVWRSDSQTNQSEAPWSEQSVDIAQYADGNPQLRIQFKQTGSFAGTNRSGWNIDWLLVRDAQAPTYDACGGCGGAPSFGGVDGVADENPCAAGGVTVRWQAASAWGTGAAGTYAVYRSTDPAFAPSTATLLASGVAGTSWVDPASPAGTRVYYIVRAENNETCGGGPANGGVVDGNLVRVAARDELAQTAPGSVGSSLRVSEVNDAHVRLSWSVSPPAASYHVRRGDTPAGAFQLAGDVAQPLFEDRDEAGSALTRFYDVRAADACGNEGP